MGKFKDKNGVSWVGKQLRAIGSIFKGKSTTSSPTKQNTTQDPANESNNGGSGWFGELVGALGGTLLGWISTKVNVPSRSDPNYQEYVDNQDQTEKKTGTGVFVGIALLIGSIVAYFIFKKK